MREPMIDSPEGVSPRKYGLELVTPIWSDGGETRLSIKPFDDGCTFSSFVNDEKQHELAGRQ